MEITLHTRNFEKNMFEFRFRAHRISEFFMDQGYIYENQIYEYLGLKWDPKNENRCAIFKQDNFMEFEYEHTEEGGIIITIKC